MAGSRRCHAMQSSRARLGDRTNMDTHIHDHFFSTPRFQFPLAAEALMFSNPTAVHAPLGLYSHTALVPAGSDLLFISGQLGGRPDGSTPPTIGEQADLVFSNIVAHLAAHGLQATDIVKLTTFMVAGCDGDAVRTARLKHLGAHRPCSTAVFVSQLVDPAWFVEVEAVAVRPARSRWRGLSDRTEMGNHARTEGRPQVCHLQRRRG